MNFLRSFQNGSNNKDHFKTEVVGEKDDRYFYGDQFSEYEDSAQKAVEMEMILGNALAMHERDNGSIHSLPSHNAVEFGRRIATMHSRDEMADSYEFGSRSSSLGSAASLPQFVRVQKEDALLLRQRSWDEEKYEEPQNPFDPPKPLSTRTWSKLRREFHEESRSHRDVDGEAGPRCTQALEDKARDLTKILRESSNRGNGIRLSRKPSESIRKGVARDYDVEVTLKNKKKFWERQPSILKKLKRKNAANTQSKNQCETPKTEASLEPNAIVSTDDGQQNGALYRCVEVTCCSGANSHTLDLITDMVPPRA